MQRTVHCQFATLVPFTCILPMYLYIVLLLSEAMYILKCLQEDPTPTRLLDCEDLYWYCFCMVHKQYRLWVYSLLLYTAHFFNYSRQSLFLPASSSARPNRTFFFCQQIVIEFALICMYAQELYTRELVSIHSCCCCCPSEQNSSNSFY